LLPQLIDFRTCHIEILAQNGAVVLTEVRGREIFIHLGLTELDWKTGDDDFTDDWIAKHLDRAGLAQDYFCQLLKAGEPVRGGIQTAPGEDGRYVGLSTDFRRFAFCRATQDVG
jgi:hypothetical protein